MTREEEEEAKWDEYNNFTQLNVKNRKLRNQLSPECVVGCDVVPKRLQTCVRVCADTIEVTRNSTGSTNWMHSVFSLYFLSATANKCIIFKMETYGFRRLCRMCNLHWLHRTLHTLWNGIRYLNVGYRKTAIVMSSVLSFRFRTTPMHSGFSTDLIVCSGAVALLHLISTFGPSSSLNKVKWLQCVCVCLLITLSLFQHFFPIFRFAASLRLLGCVSVSQIRFRAPINQLIKISNAIRCCYCCIGHLKHLCILRLHFLLLILIENFAQRMRAVACRHHHLHRCSCNGISSWRQWLALLVRQLGVCVCERMLQLW